MLKNILNLEGVQKLNKEEQKSLQGGKRGGGAFCFYDSQGRCCSTRRPDGVFCEYGRCGRWGCVWY